MYTVKYSCTYKCKQLIYTTLKHVNIRLRHDTKAIKCTQHTRMHNRHFDYKMHAEWDGAARLVILVRLSGRSGCHRAEGWATAEGPSWRKKDKREQELKRE